MAERQYVIFKLNNNEYGIDIMNVKEIIEHTDCSEVPNSPDFIRGIINYRGDIVPVIDLHKKFNISSTSITDDTRLIIFGLGDKQIGLLVDDASQVVPIDDKNVENAPSIIIDSNTKFIGGIGKLNDRMVIILDLENLLSNSEREQIASI